MQTIPSEQQKLRDLKTKHPDCIILLRIGDTYECYEKDAEDSARILGIGLARHSQSHLPYAAFPVNAFDVYAPKLIRAGKRICIANYFA